MKIKTISFKLKGKVKKIKNVIYDNRKEADYAKLYYLASRLINQKK